VTGPPIQGADVDEDVQVRALSGDHRPIGPIQPSAADHSERVGSALPGGSIVVGLPGPSLSVLDCPRGGDECLSGLGVEVAVDPDHAEHRPGDVQSPAFPFTLLPASDGLGLSRLSPVGHRRSKVAGIQRPRAMHQHRLRLSEH
jgi:hypothetical protein